MCPDLCVGVVAHDDALEVATLEEGVEPHALNFPATPMGRESLRVFLCGQARPLRLAVSGATALGFALALSPAQHCKVWLVSAAIAKHSVALAHYAARAV